tara:strand:+ start:409 stop:1326 length:918 start_codon:yes stop_codon:yes gene_type:complete
MPSSFSPNTGFTLPANGEQSGTWGNIVNDNMSIVDRLTSSVGSIALAGIVGALQIGQGTLSTGQYGTIIFGGAPSGTNTVTISPNNAARRFHVKNSSGQDVILTQGSGSSVTILNGKSATVYCNGGGLGASVSSITDSLQISSGVINGTPIGAVSASTGNFSTLSIAGASVTSSATELNLVDGSEAGVIVNEKAVIYGASGQVNATTISIGGTEVTASGAELNYVDGVTSAIQTQMDDKAPLASPTLTTPTLDSAITITGGTQSWVVTASGTNLTFSYNGVNKMRITSGGDITVTGNVTAYGAIA